MLGSTYAPQRWSDLEASKVQPYVLGVQASAENLNTNIIDTRIPDDVLIRGIEFLANGAAFGDKITIAVVDVDGIYLQAGAVISVPVNSFNIIADQQLQGRYDSICPFKLLGNLYIRISYVATGVTPVAIGINFAFLKVLI